VSPERGDRAAPPRVGAEYDIRFDNAESAKGWDELGRAAPTNLRRAYETIRATPRPIPSTERHHRLHGSLSIASRRGADLEQWQFEVTGGGRIWYLVEETTRTVWITYAGTGHPKATDRR
jgi:hypothetical protein